MQHIQRLLSVIDFQCVHQFGILLVIGLLYMKRAWLRIMVWGEDMIATWMY